MRAIGIIGHLGQWRIVVWVDSCLTGRDMMVWGSHVLDIGGELPKAEEVAQNKHA